MTAARLFWLCLWTGNLLLAFTALVWWRFGWRWGLAFLGLGPLVMLGLGCVSLLLYFVLDGGVAKDVPCEGGCGRLAPVQLRGRKYWRPLCDACERLRVNAPGTPGQIIDEGGVRIAREEYRL